MRRLGLLIPSSNVVLEPLASRLETVQVHISRLGVIDVSLAAGSRAQFELDAQVAAARLLCDAKVDSIVWGGTSASWLGVDHDRRFVERMEAETGCPTSTTVLKINAALSDIGARRIGLVTPYADDVAEQIAHVYRGLGFDVAAVTAHGGDMSRDYASIPEADIESMVRTACASGVDAIIIMCTNLAGATLAARLSAALAIPVLDSAAITMTE